MRTQTITFILLFVGWGLSWGVTNTIQAEPNLLELPWLQVLLGAIISSWGGATATLGRYVAATYSGAAFFWRLEVLKDLFVSATVGAASYFAGAFYGAPPAVLGLVLLLAGYLGVRALTAAADRLLLVVRGGPDQSPQ